jgi:type III restriction enzyme
MKVGLFDFQEDALADLRVKVSAARLLASDDNPQAISFSAPTGSGKTIMMTALFENILFGEVGFPSQPDAVFLWVSDMPELNEQTRLKIEGKSDRIRTRQLVNIDSTFDKECLEGGQIYFINTQKLGEDKLLTKQGDGRNSSIWETLTNTARAARDRFYVIIDEAHRGMREGRGEEKAKTIMQRFIKGSEEHGLVRMPLVIGMSATPRRFEELLAGTTHTVHKVYVPTEKVQKSGLLKDRILIHFPEETAGTEMSLVAEAAKRWKKLQSGWKEYCRLEGEQRVRPILVIQVEDGTEGKLTKTALGTTLATIESTIGGRLKEGEVAHTFNDSGDLDIDGRRVRKIEASRIEEDGKVGVVLFKMSLSTGWDCPRAEVMMSFRRAQDHTYIAQLLGRMVRTPLARRVERDAALNDVHLLLPHFDQAAVEAVIEDLKNVEDVPPVEKGTTRELVTLTRSEGLEDLFAAMDKLITYRVDAFRKQSALRRVIGLARALTHDCIDESALDSVKGTLIGQMAAEIIRLRAAGNYDEEANKIIGIALKTTTLQRATGIAETSDPYLVDTAIIDIDRQFDQAGRLFGNGLQMDYWRANADRDSVDVKVETIVLSQDQGCMRNLENLAEGEFDRLYELHRRDISNRKEARRNHYEKLRLATATPKDIQWHLQETIDFRRTPKAPPFDRHIYVEDDGRFRADLGTWEREVIAEELKDEKVVGWLRNVDRKQWSLEIPYRDGGIIKPMFPDIVVIRKDKKGFVFDILEPHDPSLKDNCVKSVGLAEFAEKHGHLFSRIQMIRKQRGPTGGDKFFRLDLNKITVRRQVLAIGNDNSRLDAIFKNDAT